MRIFIIVVFVCSLFVAFAERESVAIPVNDYCLDDEEAAFLVLINEYRTQNGLNELVASQMIGAAADHHSSDMANGNWFSHFWPEGTYLEADYNNDGKTSWSENMTYHGYTYNAWRGENLAAGNSTALNTFNQWKNSQGHNANMLDALWTVVGIGRAYNANSTYRWYWTTDFASITPTNDTAVPCTTEVTPTVTTVPTLAPTSTPSPTIVPTVAPTPTSVYWRHCQHEKYRQRHPERCR